MRKTTCLTLLLGVMFVVGCKPTIDTSSEDAFNKSVEKVKNSLDKDQQAKFAAAMITVMGKSISDAAMSGGPDAEKKAKAALNGKTADDIIADAQKIDPDFSKHAEQLKMLDGK